MEKIAFKVYACGFRVFLPGVYAKGDKKDRMQEVNVTCRGHANPNLKKGCALHWQLCKYTLPAAVELKASRVLHLTFSREASGANLPAARPIPCVSIVTVNLVVRINVTP